MGLKNLTSEDFNEFTKSGVSVIDFYTDWCGPCKIISPIIEQIAKEMKGVKFAKMDVDKEQELARRFEVMSIPTLIFLKNGEQVDMIVGVISKEEIVKRIKNISK